MATGVQKQTWFAPKSGSQNDIFGFPGKYHSGITVAAGETLELTGSNYGYGALMLATGAAVAGTRIYVGAAVIAGEDLRAGDIYELSPEKVTATTDSIYLFKRQQ